MNASSLDMMDLFLFMPMAMLSAPSAVAFTTPRPSRLSLWLPDSSRVLFKQGDDDDDTMYLVKEESIDIISEKSKQILKTCKKGDSFGELAITFSETNQREAETSAVAADQVREVKKDELLNTAQESDLSEQALRAYLEVYKDKRFSFEEVWEYLKINSRPKKKPVSFHSTFSIFSMGVACAALGQLCSPGIEDGYIHIFDWQQNLNDSSLLLFEIAAWMLAAAGVMGILRLPPNSPSNRKLLFNLLMWQNIASAATITSNLNGNPTAWWYDAFKLPGASLLLVTSLMVYVHYLLLLDDAIVGSNKGRESIPLMTNQGLAVVMILFLTVVFYLQLSTYAPFILASNVEGYSAMILTPFTELGMNAAISVSIFLMGFQASFVALIATLQFEKKIDIITGAAIGLFFILLINIDALGLAARITFDYGSFAAFNNKDFTFPTFDEVFLSLCPLYTPAYFGLVVATILQAIWKRAKFDDEENVQLQ